MPSTAAERKRKERQKLKERGYYEQYKANDALRKKAKRNSMTEAEKKVARQKDNERKAEAARIRAEAARIAQEIEKNAEIPFKSPQSLAKARKSS